MIFSICLACIYVADNVGVRGNNQVGTTTNVVDDAKDLDLSATDLGKLYNTPSQPATAGTNALNAHVYPMTYFSESILSVEWTNQHGCGGNEASDPSPLNCNIVLQYMCDTDDSLYAGNHLEAMKVHLKDGETTDTPTEPTSFADARTKDAETATATGRHESAFYYQECKTRKRNTGLFTADQQLRGTDARFTRQNPNGDRRGFECQEERDYYPYAFSPWIDAAYMTDELQTATVCAEVKNTSPNVMEYFKCFAKSTQAIDTNAYKAAIAARTQTECTTAGGDWLGFKHDKSKPDCVAAVWSRENHLGNANAPLSSTLPASVPNPPQPAQYNWKLPSWNELQTGNTKAKIYTAANGDQYARCVFRLRYNISTDDYDPANTNSSSNENRQTGKRSPITENPTVDVAADLAPLRLAINTAQTGRVFQDRSHTFTIKNRANLPAGVAASATVYNLNVRGKRGNIVQTFPSVEYDFMPNVLQVNKADFVHVQVRFHQKIYVVLFICFFFLLF